MYRIEITPSTESAQFTQQFPRLYRLADTSIHGCRRGIFSIPPPSSKYLSRYTQAISTQTRLNAMINSICTSLEPRHLKSSISIPFCRSEIPKRIFVLPHLTPQKPLKLFLLSHSNPPHKKSVISACAASNFDIDMVRNREGVYSAKPKKVVVLWDLDNKPPRGPPYDAAMALKKVAQHFGELVDISAYANRHAFIHLPQWVVEERRERRHLDIMERKGISVPSEAYICSVCGRKCKTHFDLKKHFRQLHERERQKKLNRMRQLKGKKRQRYKERFIDRDDKYTAAARTLTAPKVGYGLASELRRAGVFVKTVEDKPQAADWALKRQMQHSMSRGIDWLFLVSDDSDFSDMLRRAQEANLGTVVIGDGRRALGRQADIWVPWTGVQNGEITEDDLVPKRSESGGRSNPRFSVSEFDGGLNGEGSVDNFVDELFGGTELYGLRSSAFSEGEEEEDEDWLRLEIRNYSDGEDDDEMGDYMLDSEDEGI